MSQLSGIETKYSVAIISYNTCAMTLDCIASVVASVGDAPHEVIVVDNASQDGTCQAIRSAFPMARLIENKSNAGYARAVNQAVRESSSPIVLVANADTLFDYSIGLGFEFMARNPEVAAMGCSQYYPDGRCQRSYGRAPSLGLALRELLYVEKVCSFFELCFQNRRVKKVEYADGAALWFNRDIFLALGGFDEDYFFYTEEADFCHRARERRYSVVSNPDVSVVHYRGAASSGQGFGRETVEMLVSSKKMFLGKHSSTAKASIISASYVAHHLCNAILYSIAGLFGCRAAREKARIQFRFCRAWKNKK